MNGYSSVSDGKNGLKSVKKAMRRKLSECSKIDGE